MFGLTEASTRRRAVAAGGPIAASSGSILAGELFMLMVIIGNNLRRYFRPDPEDLGLVDWILMKVQVVRLSIIQTCVSPRTCGWCSTIVDGAQRNVRCRD